jgi:pilus assembly protein CpaB
MDRRRVLLGVAAVIAVMGTLLVFVYVKGADARADSRYKAVHVLTVVKQINPGEQVSAAQAAGKFAVGTVTQGQVLPGAMTDLTAIKSDVATTTLYPGEQVIAGKFGASASGTNLSIPKGMIAISLNLSDPGRVAGFVNPGDDVAVFLNYQPSSGTGAAYNRLVLPKAEIVGVGATSTVSVSKTDPSGASTTQNIPATLITLALTQQEAQKALFASSSGTLALGLLTKDSKVAPDKGTDIGNLFK